MGGVEGGDDLVMEEECVTLVASINGMGDPRDWAGQKGGDKVTKCGDRKMRKECAVGACCYTL